MIFQRIATIVLRNRLTILIVISAITVFMAFEISALRFSFQPAALLPDNDSLLVQHRHFSQVFGKGENMMVIGVQDTEFFSVSNFNQMVKMKRDLLKIDGVEQVFTTFDILTLAKNSNEKKFDIKRVFPDDSLSQTQIDSLSTIATSLPAYKGLIYNEKANVYLILVVLRQDLLITADRVPLVDSILAVTNTYSLSRGVELKYSGLPYMRTRLGVLIESEMYMLIALAVLITAVIIYLLFRSFRIMLFTLLVVAVSVVWGLGLMGLLGYPITLLTAVLPPLIIVIGVPNCVYLLNKYHHEYSIHGNKVKALQRVIQKVGSATFLTNLTTAAGFGTFMFTSIPVLFEFGLIASLDIMVVFLLSILLIPSIFSFLPPPEPRHLQHLENARVKNIISRVVVSGLYHRKAIYIVTFLLIGLGLYGLSKVESLGYMIDDIPEHHPVTQDLKFFEQNFSGVMPLDIVVDTKKPKGVMLEQTMQRIDLLQERLKKYPELSKPLSVAEMAKFARQGYYNGNPAHYRLPRGPERAFVMSYLPKNMNSQGILNRIIDSTGRLTRVMYNVSDVGSVRNKELQRLIRSDIDSVFKDDSHLVSIVGGSVVSAKGNDYLVHSLFTSLLAAIGIIALFMSWMFRKLQMVILSILPNLIPLLITAAAMGFIGIPLKPSTVLVFSIAFGISVDNSIHFLAKYRQELIRTGNNSKVSVVCAIRETGISMIYSCIVLFFGFGIFAVSQFGGTVSLGILVSLTLLIALFCNLILLPSILLSYTKNEHVEMDCCPES